MSQEEREMCPSCQQPAEFRVLAEDMILCTKCGAILVKEEEIQSDT